MPQIKEHVAANGFADALANSNQHVDESWIHTFQKVKDVYAVDPTTIPNTYLKYYLYLFFIHFFKFSLNFYKNLVFKDEKHIDKKYK